MIETALAQAQSAFASPDHQLTGTVRISAVDAVLQAFVVPALTAIRAENPRLNVELLASNEPFSLTHREVDIALRSTNRPPQHVVGKQLGSIRFGVFGGHALARNFERNSSISEDRLAALPWIAVDDAMPEHPGVSWRKRNLPDVKPVLRANTMQMVAHMIEQGLGVGILALFHARGNEDLVPLKLPLEDCKIDLWLLTHPESRHLRRITEVAARIEAHVLRAGGLP